MSNTITIEQGSGNVFADLGLPELTTDQLVAIYSKRKKRRA